MPCAKRLDLASSLQSLRGVGPKLQARLAARGVAAIEDLLALMPRAYSDRRRVTPLRALEPGAEATVEGVVVRLARPRGRRGRQLHLALAPDPSAPPLLWCRWYQHPPQLGMEDKGTRLRLCGEAREQEGELHMIHPEIVQEGEQQLVPIYPALEGIPRRSLRRWIAQVLDAELGEVELVLTTRLAEMGLPSRLEAWKAVHQVGAAVDPTADDLRALAQGRHVAQRSLVYQELYVLGVEAALRRRVQRQKEASRCTINAPSRRRFLESLPYTLTAEQQRVLGEIWDDMDGDVPMQRLLQGDVGSGKTVVALGAAAAAVGAGKKAALMAPTALLAQQHYTSLAPLCRKLGVRIGFVSRDGEQGAGVGADFVVGTHALLGRDRELSRLGLVIVDEEHRFGVGQRDQLGGDAPLGVHRLVMSATPIPRSLALALHGDLDHSMLDAAPPGRGRVETRRLRQARVSEGTEAASLLGARLAAGQQAFVVCPLREPSLALAGADAKSAQERLAVLFPRARIGIVHGALDARERERALLSFAEGATQLLVATTVVEVGVDVASAQVMVVEHAERFGLAQLHQLRGRVGRGVQGALCLLLAEPQHSGLGEERLASLERSSDGFALAEADLLQRGPGDLVGARQAGGLGLCLADLRRKEHVELLALALRHAREDLGQAQAMMPAMERALRRREERRDLSFDVAPRARDR